MKQLYQARDRIEAQLICDHLHFHGVEVSLLGDYLSGAAGELPAMQFPVIWLMHDEDESRARALLEQFQNRVTSQSDDWQCPVCGEPCEATFEICWHCGTDRPQTEL